MNEQGRCHKNTVMLNTEKGKWLSCEELSLISAEKKMLFSFLSNRVKLHRGNSVAAVQPRVIPEEQRSACSFSLPIHFNEPHTHKKKHGVVWQTNQTTRFRHMRPGGLSLATKHRVYSTLSYQNHCIGWWPANPLMTCITHLKTTSVAATGIPDLHPIALTVGPRQWPCAGQ